MNTYLTSETIKTLREQRGLTQCALAERIGVTNKAVSKWESGRGLPDISLIDELAGALGVSMAELLTGDIRTNANRSGNLLRSHFYVCPICGNIVHALGEGAFSCCGTTLLPQEAEKPDDEHMPVFEPVENEWFVVIDHPMTKAHYISFVAYVTSGSIYLQKLYPEQQAEVRIPARGAGRLFFYCNRHGLFEAGLPRRKRQPSPLA